MEECEVYMQLKASAPGSLMLLGEYAVLYGKQALVCAVDKRITVTLTPRTDDKIEIQSDLHGEYVTRLSEFKIAPPFHYVMNALKQYQGRLRLGCNLDIKSEFSDKVGFGSSAAVTIATLAAVINWFNIKISPIDLIRQGRNVIRQTQGVGSGADIAASVYGGIVGYQAQPLSVEKFAVTHPLVALYSGFKTSTIEAVKKVQEYFFPHPNLLRTLNASIGQCAIDGMQFIRKENWTKFGEIMTIQQGLMESLGVCPPLMHKMTESLSQQVGILGAKISGSGFGDCVIGLGQLPEEYNFITEDTKVKCIAIEMSLQGVQCEKI